MKKLSSREKILINILLLIVVLYFAVLQVIMPLVQSNADSKNYLSELKTQEISAKAKYKSIDTLKDALQVNLDNLQKQKASLFELMTDDKLDSYFTSLCISHDVKPESLQISDVKLEKEIKNVTPKNVLISSNCKREKLTELLDVVDGVAGVKVKSIYYFNNKSESLNIEFLVYMGNKD